VKTFNNSEDRELILIGKIVKVRGIRGQVKVYPLTDFLEQFANLKSVTIRIGDSMEDYSVTGIMFQRKLPILKFQGIDNPDDARTLIGGEIYFKRSQRIELPEDNFYFDQLEGFKVVSTAGEEVGILVDIYHLPASDVLVIDRDGAEALIPFVKALVPEMNLEERIIKVVDMPSLWTAE